MRKLLGFGVLFGLCQLCVMPLQAQDNQEAAPDKALQPAEPIYQPDPYLIGNLPPDPRGSYYTSPLKKFGTDLGLAPYAIGAFTGLMYFVVVYPVQLIVGSSTPEPVMPWLLVPIVGPWMAQYTRHVRDKPFWRVVLVTDAALQVTGLVLAIVGELLSGWREEPKRTSTGLKLELDVSQRGAVGLALTFRTL